MRGEPIDAVDRLSVRMRPPGLPIMHQHWGSLLFMHRPVPAALLRSLIPDPLVVDNNPSAVLATAPRLTTGGISIQL